jgi:hypothetical protein
MLKKSLIAIAVLALAVPAFAGSLKVHEWEIETSYKAQTICTIDVLIDVGYYIVIENQDPVTLTQDLDTNSYSGTYTTNVWTNFDADLSLSVANQLIDGDIVLGTESATINAPGDVLSCTITATDVDIVGLTAGDEGVKLCDIIITCTPHVPS